MVCHFVALIGNVRVSGSVDSMAVASEGWSDVGEGLANGLSDKLDRTMQKTTEGMTVAIAALKEVEERLDAVQRGVELVQAWKNTSGAGSSKTPPVASGEGPFANASGTEVAKATKRLAREAAEDLAHFHGAIKAVLLQVKEWLVTFGDKMQATVEGFSAGIDVVQFLLDQIMSQLRSGGGNEQRMRYESYSLFDVSGTGKVSLADIQNVSRLYSIPALQGRKSKELFAKYDENGSGELSRQEFALFVHDEALPGVMAVVLRAYARRLSAVAGLMSSARMRDEIAYATMEYLRLACAKNMTKVGWIADALSNGSLPLAFAGDVLAQLALASEHPGKSLTAVNVGEILVDKMVAISPENVADIMALLANASAWESSGFSPGSQAPTVKRVTQWVTKASQAHHVVRLLFDSFGLPRPSRSTASGKSGAATRGRQEPRVAGRAEAAGDDEGALLQVARSGAETRQGGGARELSQGAGGVAVEVGPTGVASMEALWGEEHEEAAMLQRSSKKAALERGGGSSSKSASGVAATHGAQAGAELRAQLEALPRIAEVCVEHRKRQLRWKQQHQQREMRPQAGLLGLRSLEAGVGRSKQGALLPGLLLGGRSSPDASRVISAGVLAKPETLKFAQWLASNASHTAARINDQCFDYTLQSSEATQRVASQIMKMMKRFQSFLSMLQRYATPKAIDRLERFVEHFARRLQHDLVKGLEHAQSGKGNTSFPLLDEAIEEVSRVWHKAAPILSTMVSVLPMCIDDLKLARRAVSATAAGLKSTFVSLKGKAPPVFLGVAKAYKLVCVLYFVVFVLLTVALLFYAVWASGYWSGEEEQGGEGYEPPRTLLSRLRTCLASCGRCLEACDDRQVAFWSALLLMEVLWLVMFVASQGVLMVMGVRAFVAAGCKPVYILGDETLCTEALHFISTWLGTSDWIPGAPLGQVCGQKELLVCNILDARLGGAIRLAALGNTVAAFVTFQLIIETAVMHERHRCRVALEAEKSS